MTKRSMKERVESVMKGYGIGKEVATKIVDSYDIGFEDGVKQGQEEAQRFFRLALGIDVPTTQERAFWNNRVPLKKEVLED